MREAVIVSTARTAIGKAYRGAFNDTQAQELAAHALPHAVRRARLEGGEAEDVIFGCAVQQGSSGFNVADTGGSGEGRAPGVRTGRLPRHAQVEPELREFRSRRADAFIRRNARGIADLQARGVADRGVDPITASRALSGMVSVMAYNAFVLGERQEPGSRVDFGEQESTVTRLWANALRFPGHR